MLDIDGSILAKALPKWPASLTIVRHGESARNVMKEEAKRAGKLHSYVDTVRDQDTPLTARGEAQAIVVGHHFLKGFRPTSVAEIRGGDLCLDEGPAAYVPFDTVFVSPYLRAKQTADKIMTSFSHPTRVVLDERLRELEFGILDGLTPDGIRAKYPEEIARRQKEGKYWYRPPGGESRPDVALRLHSFFDTLTRDYTGQHVLVVSHSVIVLMFRRLLERWSEEDYMRVDKEDDVKNCSITHYKSVKNKLVLDHYNHVCYGG